MIYYVLNGIFTKDYFIDRIEIVLAQFIMESNSLGTHNKIRIALTSLFHQLKIYDYEITFGLMDFYGHINILIIIKPTFFGSSFIVKSTLILQHWDKSLVGAFTEQQLEDVYRGAQINSVLLAE